jgi:GTP-binding protein
MKIEATFVRSAASAEDFPRDGAPEIALVGRSNVGKSSLINALVRRSIARTSATPGKTRLANIYRVARTAPFYLVDLPGYGFAVGERDELEAVAREYFGLEPQERRDRREGKAPALPGSPGHPARSAVLVIDARHPGLANDVSAWTWLADTVATRALVATKIDKLSRAQRQRAMHDIEAVFQTPATAVSAATGEGLEDLWKLIDRLANNSSNR